MKRHLIHAVAGCACVLTLTSPESWGCGTATITITNLPPFAYSGAQVNGLNARGQITGLFYLPGPEPRETHGFVYTAGAVADLGTLGGLSSEGITINGAGQVAGDSDTADGQSHAVLYSGGPLKDLGTLSGVFSTATAINDAGQVVGYVDGQSSAFLYSDGTTTDIGSLGGGYVYPYRINSSGLVVGESSLGSGDVHAFMFSAGTMSDMGTLDGTPSGAYSGAYAVNDSGVVVGQSSTANGEYHGFVYGRGAMTDIGTLGGEYSIATAVNSNGQVLAFSTLPGGATYHACVYAGGMLVDLGTLGGDYSWGYGMNNLGQVVGESTTSEGVSHAFLWQNGEMRDLNELLPADSGWVLNSAQFINDAGRIVGDGTLNNGTSSFFVMDVGSGEDNHAPVPVVGQDQVVDCASQVTLDASASSDPDGDAITFEWSMNGSVIGANATLTPSFPLGTNVVTLKVTDPCGLSAETSVKVAVVDSVPPTGSCPGPVSASSDDNCQAPVPNLVPQVVASDNCTPPQFLKITQDPAAGTPLGLGDHPITITVTDSAGNSSTCPVVFTVKDTKPPVIATVPGPVTVSADASCQGVVPSVLDNVLATDNCTPANQLVVTQKPEAGTLLGLGEQSIAVFVTDAAGNTATAAVTLKVVDNVAPTFLSSPGSVTVTAGLDCQGTMPNVLGDVLVTDNCTPANQLVLAQNPVAGTHLAKGQYVITVTAKDTSGNVATTAFPLTVEGTAPVIQSLVASPAVLSPPNHQLIPVTVSVSATDNCDAAPASKIISVICSETPAPGDIQITGDLTVNLAASKNSTGDARVYRIVVQCTDASGNAFTGTVAVSVPKSSGYGGGAGGQIKVR